ncbi:hypothetical protein E4T56_gene20512 [Termitomyces sp. T112]|nr:hypothetical protein E4T56_gene20512 [Termitomyces sp. T112]
MSSTEVKSGFGLSTCTLVRGSGVAKGKQQEKSKEVVESEDKSGDREDDGDNDGSDNVPLAQKQVSSLMPVASAKRPRTVASEEGEQEAEDVEMREMTPLSTVAEVEPMASRGEVEGEGEGEAEAIEVNEDAGTWSSTLLRQVGPGIQPPLGCRKWDVPSTVLSPSRGNGFHRIDIRRVWRKKRLILTWGRKL